MIPRIGFYVSQFFPWFKRQIGLVYYGLLHVDALSIRMGWVKVTRVEDTATHLQHCTLSTVCLQLRTEWTILTRNACMYPLESQPSSERRAEVVVLMAVLAAAGRRKSTVFFKQFDHLLSLMEVTLGKLWSLTKSP